MCSEDQSLFTNIQTVNNTDITGIQLVLSQGSLDILNESCSGVQQFSMDKILQNVFKDVLVPTIFVIKRETLEPYESPHIEPAPTEAPTEAPTDPSIAPPTDAPTPNGKDNYLHEKNR